MDATVHLLGNPAARAGRAGADLDAVSRALRAGGATVEVLDVASREAVGPRLASALAAGAGRIVLAGGDGLVHVAVQELAGRDIAVGIVPLGTGNDFARGLGIRSDDVATSAAAALGDPAPVDLIRTGHGWIASVATLGFSATVNARANRLSWPRGARRYSLATVLEIPAFRPRPLVIEVDGTAHELDAGIVAVGNTAYFGGGMKVCPQADPADGLLDVSVIGDVGRIELLRLLPTVYAAKHVRHRAVREWRGRVVQVRTADGASSDRAEDGLWGDGEPVGPLPVSLEAVPGALQLAGARR